MYPGDAIRGKIPPSSRVVALCIEGRMRSSEEMARMIPAQGSQDKHLVFPPRVGALDSLTSGISTRVNLQ